MKSWRRLSGVVRRRVTVLALALAALVAGAAWQHLVTGEAAQAHALIDRGERALARGDRGAATLAFKRAQWVAPRADFVRSSIKASGVEEPGPELARALALVTSREWLAIASAGAWILGLSLACLLLQGRRGRSRATQRASFAAAMVSALAIAALVEARAYPDAVVMGEDAAVRIAPYSTAEIRTSLSSGAVVLAGPEFGSFRRVQTADGSTGWIGRTSVESVVALPGA